MVNYWLSLALFYSRDRTDPDNSYNVLVRWSILWSLPTENLFYFLTHSGTIFCSFFYFLSFYSTTCSAFQVRFTPYFATVLGPYCLPQYINNDSFSLKLITCIVKHCKKLKWYWKYRLQTSEGSDPHIRWSHKYFKVHQILELKILSFEN